MAIRPLIVSRRVNQRVVRERKPLTALRDQCIRAGRPSALEVPHVYRNSKRLAIHRALKRTGGHKAKAAELLGINERTLRNKLNAEALPVWVSSSDESGQPPEREEQ